MGKADLHIHTRVSDGMASVSQVLEYVEHRTDLDVVAITDHEDVEGGLRARELAAKRGYRFDVIVGAEVTTMQGHVIGLFLETTPASFRRVESTIEMIHNQGGLAVAPHPLSWLTRSISSRTLNRLARQDGPRFDAIELASPSPAALRTRERAVRLNNEVWRLPAIGSSDAHHLGHIATGWTEFEGSSSDAVRDAMRSGQTTARMSVYPSMREIGFARLAAGLAWGYSATPRKMLRRRI
ncbi:MAG: PHP domain-containing protein [Dehalococcoidia bacterium]|nr:PHP domain-containing protein [Dehalococcoidia bacterium]